MTQNLALFRTARGSALAKMIASCSGLDEQLSDIDILRVWLNVKLGLDARSRFFVVFDRDTDEYQKIHKIISKTPLLLFIRAYATSLVSDPDGLSILFRKSESELDSTVAIGILSVHEKNLVTFDKLSELFDYENDASSEQMLKKMYKAYSYKANQIHRTKLIPKFLFKDFLRCVFCFPAEKEPVLENSELAQAGMTLKSVLNEPRKNQFAIVEKFYSLRAADQYISFDNFKENFSKKIHFSTIGNDVVKRHEAYNQVMDCMNGNSPLDVLKMLRMGVRVRSGGNDGRFKAMATNVSIECGIIFEKITTELKSSRNLKNVSIVNPSLFFIEKFVNAHSLEKSGYNVTFAMSDENEAKILDLHFRNRNFCNVVVGDDIRFVSFEKYAKCADIGNVQSMIIFDVDNIGCEYVNFLLTDKLDPEARVLVEVSDTHLHDIDLDNSGLNIDSLLTLPSKIGFLKNPKLKSIALLKRNNGCAVRTLLMKSHVIRIKEKHYIFLDHLHCMVMDSEKITSGKYRSTKEVKERERKNGIEIEFLPGIKIRYTTAYHPSRKDISRYTIYTLDPNTGKELAGSKKVCAHMYDVDIRKYILEEYAFNAHATRRKGGEPERILFRDVITQKYTEYLENQYGQKKFPCLKTFMYLYEAALLVNPSKKVKEIFRDIYESQFALYDMSDITEDEIDDFISSNENRLNNEKSILRLMGNIFDLGLEKSLCHKEPSDYIKAKLLGKTENLKSFNDVRRALAKKTFTLDEYKNVIGLCLDRWKKDIRYIGVLIRLVTGLESNIVCALRWQDFKLIKSLGFHCLDIYQQVTNDGSAFKTFESEDDYRRIPCMQLVENVLLAREKNLQAMYGKDIQSFFIVSDKVTSKDGSGFLTSYAPCKLDYMIKNMLAELDIEDVVIDIPDNNGGTKESNLSSYQGDIFRENFKYWIRDVAGLNEDEVSYLIGNKRKTTFGIHYCDYMNEKSQFTLFSKLRRVNFLLEYGNTIFSPTVLEFEDNLVHDFKLDSNLNLQIELETFTNTGDPVDIEVESEYGAKLLYKDKEEAK